MPQPNQSDFLDEENTIAEAPRIVLQAGPVASDGYMARIVEAARIERRNRLGIYAPKESA
jgi:hypothetical protein